MLPPSPGAVTGVFQCRPRYLCLAWQPWLMICHYCQAAGRLLSAGTAEPDPRLAWAGRIADLHGACRGGTWCDCQHGLTPGTVRARAEKIIRGGEVTGTDRGKRPLP